jgi:hypothetical protein
MEDFNALAAALGAGIQDVRGCLILSRDGLVLGAHPVGMEGEAKHSWIRFASLGEPERGFVQFGTEVWCFVRRGPYAAFALTGTGVRPGLVIDHMEEVLLAAEESRARHSGLRIGLPETATVPSGPRAPLHPEARPVDDVPVVRPEPPPERPTPAPPPQQPVLQTAPAVRGPSERPPEAEGFGEAQPDPSPEVEPPRPVPPEVGPPRETPTEPEPRLAPTPAADDDVDRFSLAREFSQLLQEERGPSDG